MKKGHELNFSGMILYNNNNNNNNDNNSIFSVSRPSHPLRQINFCLMSLLLSFLWSAFALSG
jgi:hypothetical protein